jgi:cytochrome P450
MHSRLDLSQSKYSLTLVMYFSLYSLMEIWSQVMETGATPPVDIYPFLHWLPQRIFLNWRDRATQVQQSMNSLYSSFLSDLRSRRAATGSRASLMDKVLDQVESEKAAVPGMTYSDHELWFLGGTLTEGSSDTSASIITAFVQAMLTNPDVQREAQAEIDAVIPANRSPTWADYASLPYVAQCVKETMRWRPVTPLAFPHALAQDDWVDGYFLPKGTTVIINAWGMQHDTKRYSKPEAFDPEHFAGCTKLAPELANGPWEERDHYGYGAGRRLCPGIHLAERNLFLAMAKLLWAFEILPAVDAETGVEVEASTDPREAYCEGFLVCAYDFPARFRVRGEERRETVMREFGEEEGVFRRFEG